MFAASTNGDGKMYGLLPGSGLVQRCTVRPTDAVCLRLRLFRPRDLVLLAESAAFPEYLSLLVCSLLPSSLPSLLRG